MLKLFSIFIFLGFVANPAFSIFRDYETNNYSFSFDMCPYSGVALIRTSKTTKNKDAISLPFVVIDDLLYKDDNIIIAKSGKAIYIDGFLWDKKGDYFFPDADVTFYSYYALIRTLNCNNFYHVHLVDLNKGCVVPDQDHHLSPVEWEKIRSLKQKLLSEPIYDKFIKFDFAYVEAFLKAYPEIAKVRPDPRKQLGTKKSGNLHEMLGTYAFDEMLDFLEPKDQFSAIESVRGSYYDKSLSKEVRIKTVFYKICHLLWQDKSDEAKELFQGLLNIGDPFAKYMAVPDSFIHKKLQQGALKTWMHEDIKLIDIVLSQPSLDDFTSCFYGEFLSTQEAMIRVGRALYCKHYPLAHLLLKNLFTQDHSFARALVSVAFRHGLWGCVKNETLAGIFESGADQETLSMLQ